MPEPFEKTQHTFRRLARRRERQLREQGIPAKVVQLSPGQRDRWGKRWAVVEEERDANGATPQSPKPTVRRTSTRGAK